MQLKWPMLWDLFSLFPAHAGVILCEISAKNGKKTFPRTRGGDPEHKGIYSLYKVFSPHTRG